MSVHGGLLRMDTPGNGHIVDLTAGVASVIRTTGVNRGFVNVFVTGSTAAITTMEYEPGRSSLRGRDERRVRRGREPYPAWTGRRFLRRAPYTPPPRRIRCDPKAPRSSCRRVFTDPCKRRYTHRSASVSAGSERAPPKE